MNSGRFCLPRSGFVKQVVEADKLAAVAKCCFGDFIEIAEKIDHIFFITRLPLNSAFPATASPGIAALTSSSALPRRLAPEQGT